MSIRWHQSFVILAALGACAFAQETVTVTAGGGGNFRYFSMQAGPGDKTVKGAPYTAEAVTETVQTLANGTRITHKSTAQLARDSEGRTRREQTLDAVGPWATSGEPPKFILLNDPVAGVSYQLDPKTNTAVKMPSVKGAMPPPLGPAPQLFLATSADGPVAGAAMARMKADATAAAIEAGGTAPAPGAISILKIKEPGDAKTESLGQQTIDGLAVTGTRITRTIPAGAIGNDQAIEVVSETWYSPELQMVVMSKHSDPQIGETTYKLTNIQQGQPPHSLFEVPANYTIRDEKPILMEQPPVTAPK